MTENQCIVSSEEEAETVAIVFCIFSLLLGLVLVLSKVLHDRPKLNQYLSEPAMILIVGIITGYLFSLKVDLDADDEEEKSEAQDYYEADDVNNAAVDGFGEEFQEVGRLMIHFSPHIFYLGLLPPIMYNSGYELERDMFMRHFEPISLFAVLGTTVSAFGTGFLLYLFKYLGWFTGFNPSVLELLTFGALIAATDTVSVLGVLQSKRVDPHLFSLVFGESALNDGVAIVLFKTLAGILEEGDRSDAWTSVKVFVRDVSIAAIGSPIMGIMFSFLLALVFKVVDFRHQPIIELSLFVLLMYVPFVLAEILQLSGIVGIFFAGIFARRYITPNLSEESQHNAKVIFKLGSYLAETCIFLHVGLSIFGFAGDFKWDFIAFALLAALAGRAMSIYPISLFFNCTLKETVKDPLLGVDDDDASIGSASTASTASLFQWKRKTPERKRDKKIPFNFMHILWFAGLRGAVAYSCVVNFPNVNGNRDHFVAATIIIVLVTIIIMGGAAEYMIRKMNIRVGVDDKEYMKEWREVRKVKGCFHRIERRYLQKTALRDYADSKKDLPSNPYHIDEIVCVHTSQCGPQQTQTSGAAQKNGSYATSSSSGEYEMSTKENMSDPAVRHAMNPPVDLEGPVDGVTPYESPRNVSQQHINPTGSTSQIQTADNGQTRSERR